MKALYFTAHGSTDNLQYGELEDPEPGPGEVLIRVKAAALNRLDLFVLEGWPGLEVNFPHIGGADIAGEVAALGKGVREWEEGERVVVNPGSLKEGKEDEWTKRGDDSLSPRYEILGENRQGGFAEYVCVPAKSLLAIPEDIDFPEAAAPLLVGVTAWRMLIHRAHLQAGQSVLIVGAGGGLNSFAVQLAKALGAKVVALTSSEKVSRVAELGADHVIDYQQTPEWAREVRRVLDDGADIVVDNVGATTFKQSIYAAKRGGSIVTVGNTGGHEITFDNRILFTKQVSILGSTMGSKRDFREVMQTVWGGKITPVIDHCAPLSEGKEAYQALERGEQFGKIVLTP